MADDCLLGFKFLEKDDLINDAAVKEAAENMFSEVVFDAASDLDAKVEDAFNSKAAGGFERLDCLENFDFSESSDFVF